MPRPLLALCMILKNEATAITDTLASLHGIIDRWTIIDTGSTDATRDLVRAILEDVPGRLYEEPFVDYATTRNRALEIEAADPDHAEFALMLSGDEKLGGGLALREFLEAHRETGENAFNVWIQHETSRWVYPRITRVGGPWRYEGRIHESLVAEGQDAANLETLPESVYVEHFIREPEKRALDILDRHVPVLEDMLAENPDDPRALLFLGQSLADTLSVCAENTAKTIALEAMSYFMRRLALDGCPDDEKAYATLRYLLLAQKAGVYTDAELLARVEDLCASAPLLAEAFLLRASTISRLQPVLRVLDAAAIAADVARSGREIVSRFPRDTSAEWRASLLAAMAANRAARYEAKYADLAGAWAKRVREAGGPPVSFQQAEEGDGGSAEVIEIGPKEDSPQ